MLLDISQKCDIIFTLQNSDMKREDSLRTVQTAFDLLGNPLRLSIFLKIAREGCDCNLNTQQGYTGNCVSGVMKELGIAQSTASSYLKDLQNWQLIECKKNGKFLYCRPKRETLLALKSFIDSCLMETKKTT